MSNALAGSKLTSRHLRGIKSPAMLVLLLGLLFALLLALPGVTIVTRSLDELLLFVAGVHRIVEGQVPSRDFLTDLGPLTYYLPALAYAFTGSYGAALPLALGSMVAIMAVIASHVLASRLHPFLALPFAAFLLLILAAPMNLGEPIAALSFTMFYNRLGWVALALLLTLYLTPRPDASSFRADAISAAGLTILLLYLRAPYGFVALSFLLFMLTDGAQRRWAAAALLATVGAVAAMALLWSGSSPYWSQALAALQVDGKPWFDLERLLRPALGHLVDLLLLGLLVVVALWRRWRWRDVAFFLLCVIGGLWLLSYNVQRWGVITIHLAAVVAAEQLIRKMDEDGGGDGAVVNRSGITLYMLAFVLPTIVHCGLALILHAGAATVRAGEPLALERVEGVYLADLWPGGDQRGALSYANSVREGLALLDKQPESAEGLAVFGSVDAFTPVLDLAPAASVSLDMRWPSLVAQGSHSPENILKESKTVLVRRSGELGARLPALYMQYLTANFFQADESANWLLYRRTGAGSSM